MSTILEVKNLSVTFEKRNVFSELNFSLEEGKITVLYGKSGIGKTTLLKCLTLLELPAKGSIVIYGQNVMNDAVVHNEHIVREKIGIVFQDFYLWDNKTVLENISEALIYAKGMGSEESSERAEKVAQSLHLDHELLSKYPPELSRGQRQRVAIARTLVMDYEIILFDEPTASLDKALVAELIRIIKVLRDQGKTILVVSHDSEFTEKVGDTILNFEDLMNYGRKGIST